MPAYKVFYTNRTKTTVSPNGAVDLIGTDTLEEVGIIEPKRTGGRGWSALNVVEALVELFGGWSNVESCYSMRGPMYNGLRYNVRNKRRNQKHISNNEVLLIEIS